MKKYIALAACAVIFSGIVACKKSPEKQATALFTDMKVMMDDYSQKITDAKTGKEAADVLIDYSEKAKKLSERANDLKNKFPDLKFIDDAVVKAESEKLQASLQKFFSAVMAASVKFNDSKDFQDAIQKVSQSMK